MSIPPFIASPVGVDASPGRHRPRNLRRPRQRGSPDGRADRVSACSSRVHRQQGGLHRGARCRWPSARRPGRGLRPHRASTRPPAPTAPSTTRWPGFAADVWAVAATAPAPTGAGRATPSAGSSSATPSSPTRSPPMGLAIIASGPAALPEDQQTVLRDVRRRHEPPWARRRLAGKRAMDAAAGARRHPPDMDDFLTRRFLSNSPGSLQAMIETLCTTSPTRSTPWRPSPRPRLSSSATRTTRGRPLSSCDGRAAGGDASSSCPTSDTPPPSTHRKQ